MKILFAGGGTLGPVTPLLAVIEALKEKQPDAVFVWVGTPHGPERDLLERRGIRFLHIPAARLPRHPSIEWLFLPFKFVWSMYRSWSILSKEKPDVLVGAGGYTSVPLLVLGRFFGIPSWIHHQDVAGLLTHTILSPFVSKITVSWEPSLGLFPAKKTSLVGNPVRKEVLSGSRARAVREFDLDLSFPTVFVTGGGTGAKWINESMFAIADELAKSANVIHITGKGKMVKQDLPLRYHAVEFLDEEMADAFSVADVVVSRAGMGTMTELAAMAKSVVLIPIPNSPQVVNASVVSESVKVVDQDGTTPQMLLEMITALLGNDDRRKKMGFRLRTLLRTDVAPELADMILELGK